MNKTQIAESISFLVEDSLIFNEIAGKGNNFSEEAIADQIKLINEEVLELNEAFRQNDATEVLDAVIDIFVVLSGLTQQLAGTGVNIAKAAQLVTENNLSKFPDELSVAEKSVKALKGKGIEASASFNAVFNVYCIKDKNNKVRKPITFKDVELQSCLPDYLLQHGFTKEQ